MRDPDEARSLAGARALREALRMARLGYLLVPVTITREPDGKKLAKFHTSWRDGGSSRPDVVRDWSVQHPACSFAILCGPSGLEVLDLDAAEGGPAWWAAEGMPVSDVVVDTPGGGQHHWWRRRPGAEPDDRLVNNAGKVAPGVDARTIGGLVFAPGSYVVGQEDQPYLARTEVPEVDALAETPRPVLALWARARAARPRSDFAPGQVDQARQFTQDEATAYIQAEAQRPLLDAQYGINVNDTLNRAALVVGHFVPEFWSQDEARAALVSWLLAGPGARNGWTAPDREDIGSIESGLRRGMAEPYARRVAPSSNHLADGVPVSQDPQEDTVDRFAGLAVPAAGSAHEVGAGPALADLPEPPTALEVALERGRIQRQVRRLLDAEERPPDPGPGGFTLAEFLAQPDEGEAWRVDRLWPAGGKVLLAAPAKAGKTTTVMNLVRALVDAGHGARFLDKPITSAADLGRGPEWKVAAAGFAVAPLAPGRRVALLDFEMTARLLRMWLRGQSIRNLDGLVIEPMRGRTWDIRDRMIRDRWASWLRERAVDVLVVDPIGPILHGLGIDENDNSAVGGFLTALDALVRDAGVSDLFVVHHAGHGGDEGEERARGASSFLGWPDALWTLGRSKTSTARGLRAEGRDVHLPDTVLEHDAASHRMWLGEGSRSQVAHSADAAIVEDLVAEECESRGSGQAGPGVRELERLLRDGQGWNKTRAERALQVAANLGLVHVHPGGMYPGQQRTAKLHHPGNMCTECPVSPSVPPVS